MSADAPAGWSSLRAGTALYARGEMRAAHEAWEDAWRAQPAGLEGQVARALAQLAAAGVHLEAGRTAGFASVGAKCAHNLRDLARQADPGVRERLEELARRVEDWAAGSSPTLAARPPIGSIPG